MSVVQLPSLIGRWDSDNHELLRDDKTPPPIKLKTAEAIASAAFCSPQNEMTMA